MADPGFTDLPATDHFTFEFDNRLDAAGAMALGAFLAAHVEDDYALVNSWFDNLSPAGLPFNVKISPRSPIDPQGSNIFGKQISLFPGSLDNFQFQSTRQTLVDEFVEILMESQQRGWKADQSHGEGLSRFAGILVVPTVDPGGPAAWLASSLPTPPSVHPSRPDFVSVTDDSDARDVSFGCALLFLYYLNSQLGFTPHAIVQAAAPTLEGVYHNLTQDSDAFPAFAGILAAAFPPDTRPGSFSGSPFPLPAPGQLSLRRYLQAHPLGNETLRERIHTLNVGNLRAVLNSDRPASFRQ